MFRTKLLIPQRGNIVLMILAAVLYVSPWVLGYHSNVFASLSTCFSATVVLLLAGLALVRYVEWEEWLNLFVGLWLILSPWILDFADEEDAKTVHVVVGALIILDSAWEIWQTRHRRRFVHI